MLNQSFKILLIWLQIYKEDLKKNVKKVQVAFYRIYQKTEWNSAKEF